MALTVASPDKRFLIRYTLEQEPTKRLLVIMGQEFPGVARDGCNLRIRCPAWENDAGAITPGAVTRLLDWCFSVNRETLVVDWKGDAPPGPPT